MVGAPADVPQRLVASRCQSPLRRRVALGEARRRPARQERPPHQVEIGQRKHRIGAHEILVEASVPRDGTRPTERVSPFTRPRPQPGAPRADRAALGGRRLEHGDRAPVRRERAARVALAEALSRPRPGRPLSRATIGTAADARG